MSKSLITVRDLRVCDLVRTTHDKLLQPYKCYFNMHVLCSGIDFDAAFPMLCLSACVCTAEEHLPDVYEQTGESSFEVNDVDKTLTLVYLCVAMHLIFSTVSSFSDCERDSISLTFKAKVQYCTQNHYMNQSAQLFEECLLVLLMYNEAVH